jgi:hypothetical protein
MTARPSENLMFQRSVRANRRERSRPLPGDPLIPEPIASLTQATTMRRPPREVWPWLIQMGAGARAGWYSYDFIDNGRQRSADRIVPDLQTIAVGALLPAAPGATDGGYPFYGLPPWVGMPVVRLGHAIMERKQLLGIASRVESREPSGHGTRAATA